MPDESLNLTPEEAASLGYETGRGVRRVGHVQGPPHVEPDIDSGWVGFVGVLLLMVMAAAMFSEPRSSVAPQSQSPGATQSTTTAQSSQVGSSAQSRSATDDNGGTSRQQQTDGTSKSGSAQNAAQYLTGWNYTYAGSPIQLRDSDSQVGSTIPSGTEFLRTFPTSNGWSFVVTLDGEMWGWARLSNPAENQKLPMDPKFEKALNRSHAVTEGLDHSASGTYIPEGWDYSVANFLVELHRDRNTSEIVPAGVEFLRSFQTSNGWSFVVTLDGRTWGWARLAPKTPRRILMDRKFKLALARLNGLGASPPSQEGAYLPDGWVHEIVMERWTVRHDDGTVYAGLPGTEYLRYSKPVDGQWFVVTLDGETWGWTGIHSNCGLWPIRIAPKYEKALERIRTLNLSQKFEASVVY